MQMWGSTAKETQPPPKNRWLTLGKSERSDVACFLDCLESGQRPQVTARDAVHHVEVLMAAYESAVSEETVYLSP